MALDRSSGWPGALLQILQQICCTQYFTIIVFGLGKTTKCQDWFPVIQYLVHLVDNVALLKRWWQFKLLVAGQQRTVKKSHRSFEFSPSYSISSDRKYHQLGQKCISVPKCVFIHHRWCKNILLLHWWAKIHHICQKTDSILSDEKCLNCVGIFWRGSKRMSENSTKCCKIPLHKLEMCCFTF